MVQAPVVAIKDCRMAEIRESLEMKLLRQQVALLQNKMDLMNESTVHLPTKGRDRQQGGCEEEQGVMALGQIPSSAESDASEGTVYKPVQTSTPYTQAPRVQALTQSNLFLLDQSNPKPPQGGARLMTPEAYYPGQVPRSPSPGIPPKVTYYHPGGVGQYLLRIDSQGNGVYVPWKTRDVDVLVNKLPQVTKGAGSWIRAFEAETRTESLCLGDLVCLLSKLVGTAATDRMLTTAGLFAQGRETPFTQCRGVLWGAMRQQYPQQTQVATLKSRGGHT